MMRHYLLHSLLILAVSLSTYAAPAPSLEETFANPPARYGPRCYWYWQYGNITREGITRDLEAMKRFGISEPYIGIIEGGGPVLALSEPWWQLLEHAVREAGRLGLDIGLFNSPGWSQSGGPWVRPEQSMRMLSTLEVAVSGPRLFDEALPAPEGFFQDVKLIAFPAPRDDALTLAALSPVVTGDPAAGLTYAVPTPFTARSLVITPAKKLKVTGELSVSDDGVAWRTVRSFTVDRSNLGLNVGSVPLAPEVVSFPAVTARWFRVRFSAPCDLASVNLRAAPRVDSVARKQLQKMFPKPVPPFDAYTWPAAPEPDSDDLVVAPEKVIDLTALRTDDGRLHWQVPAGDWIIQRAVARSTGIKNSPAPAEATGLEIDKMSRPHLAAHFNAYVGKLLARMPAADRTALKHVVADSYEMGPQNWTDDLLADFNARYRYDPAPFLPVLGGRIVGSADRSDRFLWDLRRLVADRIALDYVGGLRDLCHQSGLKLWLENYGHWGFPAEFLNYGGQSDELGGEFWVNNDSGDSVELRAASSATQIYGKSPTFAEAFTGGPAFTSTPWSLKRRGDWAFTQGINQFVLHVFIHQPDPARRPGVNAWYGTEFNHHNTWFEQGRAWVDYLRRSAVLLQTGNRVTDVAYFIGEDAPKMSGLRDPALPAGRDYTFINAEVILNRLAVHDGEFVLPDGARFRVLVLPSAASMRPAVLARIRDLVDAGGTVVGSAPARSPSGENFPQADRELQGLAAGLWPAGKIKPASDLEPVFKSLQLPPDLSEIDSAKVLFTHRRSDSADLYFLTNQTDAPLEFTPAFRATGAPELWHADTGLVERLAAYDTEGPLTRVPLFLPPRGSVFVVFRGQPSPDRIIELRRDNQPQAAACVDLSLSLDPQGRPVLHTSLAGTFQMRLASGQIHTARPANAPAPLAISGPWSVTFDPAQGGPAIPTTFASLTDWRDHADPAIRHYSGTATYRISFDAPPAEGTRWLDLGDIGDLARVTLNGHEAGTLWKKPYLLDVSRLLRPERNELTIEVVNTWRNRLVGDRLPGVSNPVSQTTHDVKLSPSDTTPAGLLGPVRIETTLNTPLEIRIPPSRGGIKN